MSEIKILVPIRVWLYVEIFVETIRTIFLNKFVNAFLRPCESISTIFLSEESIDSFHLASALDCIHAWTSLSSHPTCLPPALITNLRGKLLSSSILRIVTSESPVIFFMSGFRRIVSGIR